jgi:hypothetical protein
MSQSWLGENAAAIDGRSMSLQAKLNSIFKRRLITQWAVQDGGAGSTSLFRAAASNVGIRRRRRNRHGRWVPKPYSGESHSEIQNIEYGHHVCRDWRDAQRLPGAARHAA